MSSSLTHFTQFYLKFLSEPKKKGHVRGDNNLNLAGKEQNDFLLSFAIINKNIYILRKNTFLNTAWMLAVNGEYLALLNTHCVEKKLNSTIIFAHDVIPVLIKLYWEM